MTTYVLGAGASHGAGYPLAESMGTELLQWMKKPAHDLESYEARYPDAARFLEEVAGGIGNIEDLVTEIQKLIRDYEKGTAEERAKRTIIANQYGVLKQAVRSWFAEIQSGVALDSKTYRSFAENIVAPDDCIITFNYDVSLDRELKLAGKFEVGDGYGFPVEIPTGKSSTKLLKLHGSTSWLALLFEGLTSGVAFFKPGATLSERPVLPKNELLFLGYSDVIDPRFTRGGAALPVMIFPARSKNFYFEANTGEEYAGFWNSLWRQAELALRSSTRIVICGYSLLGVDERARKLLLNTPQKRSEVIVACGNDTDRIVKEFRDAGYARAAATDEVFFEKWVSRHVRSVAEIRS